MTKERFLNLERTEGFDYAIEALSETDNRIKYCINMGEDSPWFYYNGITLAQLNTVDDVEVFIGFDKE